MTEAITADNLTEQRRQADDARNLNHMIPGARDTANVTPDIVEAVNDLGDKYGMTDWMATEDERVRVMLAWCERLPNLGLVPLHHDPGTADWHWGGVRCLLAGAGYGAHRALASYLVRVYPQCPLRPDETGPEWSKALAEAHNHSGIPASILAWPWHAFRSLPSIPRHDTTTMGLRWMTAVALVHLLKHTRATPDEVRVYYRGSATFHRVDTQSNSLSAQGRVMLWMLAALGMERDDARAKDASLMALGTSRAIKGMALTHIPEALPLSRASGHLLVGTFTQLASDPADAGWFQHGLRLSRAWLARDGRTRPFSGDDSTVMAFAWTLDRLDEDQQTAFSILEAAVPADYTVDSPTTILRNYQPNIMDDWTGDLDAYESLLDAVFCVALMRNKVPMARKEYPILWVLPNEPTRKGSTNQGKTTCVGAIAGSLTPGIQINRPPDSNSAPDMRVVAGLIKREGTIALDEWAMPKNQSHPLSARSLQSLATGNGVAQGEVLENCPKSVRLRQPVVASTKCVTLPEDVHNRSMYLFMRPLTAVERKQVIAYQALTTGEVSLRMRLAALGLVEQFGLDQLAIEASENLRFPLHVAVACKLYALRTGKTGQESAAALDALIVRMDRRIAAHTALADESGLASEMDSGEYINIRASDVFAGMSHADLTKLADILKEHDRGRVTAGQLLRGCVAVNDHYQTVRGMLGAILGYTPKANDRALTQAFDRDLAQRTADHPWMLPDTAGLDGWKIERVAEGANGTLRIRLVCGHPSMPSVD